MCDIGGFVIYGVSLLFVFLAVFIVRYYSLVSLVVFLCVAFIAAYRGDAGIDTPLYIIRFSSVGDFIGIGLIEPLTAFLMWGVSSLGGEFSDFSLLYGLILSLLYFFLFKKYPNAIYFGLAVFPVIFLDSLYNGVRIGLAYPLMFLAIAGASLWMYVIAFNAHVSTLLIGAFRIIPWKYFIFLFVSFMVLVFFIGITIDVLPYRYASKFITYQELSSSSSLAGIADTTALWFALVIYLRVIGFRGARWLLMSFLIFSILFVLYFILIKEFVFMLRVVRLMLISVFALIAARVENFDKLALFLCSLFGVVYMGNFLRQISSSCSYEHGGFLPLQFNLY